MSTPVRARAAALLAGVAAAALSVPALAQPAAELPPVEAAVAAEPQAPATGQSTLAGEVLARRRAGAADSMSLIAGEPGVGLYANGGVSSLPVVRGLADDRVLVTIDGAESTAFCPNHMNPTGSYVSPARVDEISIQPTLSPVSAGGDNIAGVIAVTTRPPAFAAEGEGVKVEGEVGASLRSVADAVGASGRVSLAGERLSLTYEAAWNRADNYKSGEGRRVRSTLYEAYDQALTLAWLTDRGVLSLKAGRQFQPYQGFPTQRMDLTENDSLFADLRYEASYGWGELTAKASWRSVDHEMNFLADKGGSAAGGMPMLSQGRDLAASLAAAVPLKDGGSARVGLEAHRADLDDWWPPVAGSMMMGPQTYWNVTDGRRERTGVWGEWEARPAERWTTHLGARYEHVETDAGPVQPYAWTGMMNMADAMAARAFNARDRGRADDNLDLTAKAVWRASQAATLEFGYARKTRTPNLYERYAWGRGAMSSAMTSFAGDANSYVGDPDLKPEVAHHLAATLNLAGEGRELTVSVYRSQVEDFIDAVKLADLANGFVRLRFANVDAELYGLDAKGAAQVWDTPGFGRGVVTATLSYVQGENRDSGDDLYHMTPLTVRLGLEQAKGRWTNVAEVELVGEKDAVNALRHEPQTAAYALMNLRSSWTTGRLRADVAVENLFDTAYDLPLGGVSYGDYRAAGSTGAIQPLPGPGRSFNLALTLAF
ncbi:MAG: TonB-dependent receptor [Phenylobacterium sp.]|uniref:TonB-dependent receptor n=1 Tax=Phenylobacterium sp. TaxID=1871053 RepID=UPI00391C0070